jgi:hypothetical protein
VPRQAMFARQGAASGACSGGTPCSKSLGECRPEALVLDVLGLSAGAARVRAGRRDGANVACCGTRAGASLAQEVARSEGALEAVRAHRRRPGHAGGSAFGRWEARRRPVRRPSPRCGASLPGRRATTGRRLGPRCNCCSMQNGLPRWHGHAEGKSVPIG